MSVRKHGWTNKAGGRSERWMVDVKMNVPGRGIVRIRDFSPIDTRRGAEQHERNIRNALADGSWWKAKQETPRMADFEKDFLEWAATNNSASELRAKGLHMKNHLLPFFGKTKLDAIGRTQVEAFKAHQLRKGLSGKTINNHLAILSKLLGEAQERGIIATVPKITWMERTKPEIDFLSHEEFRALIDNAEPGRWRTMVGLILNTGLRIGEACALKWENVDLTSKRLRVTSAVLRGVIGTPKNGKARDIPLNDEAIALLHEMPKRVGSPWVFPNQDGGFIRQTHLRSFYAAFRRQCTRAGISRRIGWHTLRHTFASHLVMAGVPLKAVQELLGHGTIEMTMRYAHLSPNTKRDAVQALLRPVTESGQGQNRGKTKQTKKVATKKGK